MFAVSLISTDPSIYLIVQLKFIQISYMTKCKHVLLSPIKIIITNTDVMLATCQVLF